jgi:hypothetical protein
MTNCPNAQIQRNMHAITGTAGFGLDHTYGWKLRDIFDIMVEIPQSCVADSGGCAGFALFVTLALKQTVDCTPRAQSCDCVTMGTTEDQQQGRYSAVSGTITTTRSDGKVRSYYYCVTGDRALYRRTDDGIVFLIGR